MRAHCLFLACLALLASPALGGDDAAPEAASAAAAAPAAASSSGAAAVSDEPKETEMLDVAESSNNNTAAADEEAGGSRSNTKRTIDHSLGYGYRYNTVLRPVGHHHHYMPQPRRPMLPMQGLPMYKLQQRYPHHFFSSSASGSSGSGSSAPFRFSQPLPSPPQREEPQLHQPQPQPMSHGEHMSHGEPMAPRPVTEAPSGPHSDTVSLYRTLSQPQPEQHAFTYEDDLPKAKQQQIQQQQQQSELEAQGDAQPVQYADEAPAPHSYQQVLQAEPTYFLTSAAASPAASHMFAGSSPLAAMYSHGLAHAAHPVMYATAGHGQHAAATQMIPVIIVRLMDSHAAAASLAPSATLAHAVSPLGHAMGHSMGHSMGHTAAMPYPLVNMQFLRDYLSKLYAPAAVAPAQPQYVTASEPDPLLYSSQLFGSTQLQKLQLQQQLHAQLQKQLQMQVQQQQQQQQRPSQSVAEILQEQHRQRVAAAQAQQGRTEVTVHRSPAMSPQDYKESVEQQEEA